LTIALSRLSRASTTSISPRASAASRPWIACSLAGSAFRPRVVSTASVLRSTLSPSCAHARRCGEVHILGDAGLRVGGVAPGFDRRGGHTFHSVRRRWNRGSPRLPIDA
jgi:hypothetical protein